MEGFKRWLRDVVPPIATILLLDLAVTLVFLFVSGAPARIGTLRPINTIPGKGLELLLVGGAVGLAACLTARRLDHSLLTLAIAFVALIDVDHLPSMFGVEQPIRPAHSFAFLAVELVVLGVTFRKRPELVLLAAAAWFGHLAGDTGVFALFAPFSFDYSSLGPYRVPFAVVSAASAFAAGYLVRQRRKAASFHQ